MSFARMVRHRRRRTKYVVLGVFDFEPEGGIATEGDIIYVGGVSAELQASGGPITGPVRLVVYQDFGLGQKRWARLEAEFNDGRFEEI